MRCSHVLQAHRRLHDLASAIKKGSCRQRHEMSTSRRGAIAVDHNFCSRRIGRFFVPSAQRPPAPAAMPGAAALIAAAYAAQALFWLAFCTSAAGSCVPCRPGRNGSSYCQHVFDSVVDQVESNGAMQPPVVWLSFYFKNSAAGCAHRVDERQR